MVKVDGGGAETPLMIDYEEAGEPDEAFPIWIEVAWDFEVPPESRPSSVTRGESTPATS